MSTPAWTGYQPGLRAGVRATYDDVRGRHVLLYPEGMLVLNETAAAVLVRCTGRTVGEIAEDLAREWADVSAGDVRALVADLVERRVLTCDGTGRPARLPAAVEWAGEAAPAPPRSPVPAGMVAELTYRCPLQCAYCSNPVELAAHRAELPTADWVRVLREARRLGVLQLHLSGGEPLLRRDLAELIAVASGLGLYTNLVTSGIPLNRERMARLAVAGLDHVQLSLQDAEAAGADAVAGIRAHERKLAAAALIRGFGLPLTVNAVLHAGNIDRVAAIAALAVELGADRVELAHTQFYGWGWLNRAALLPAPEQLARAEREVAGVRERYGDRVEIVHVAADYHGDRPKPCMYGWGTRQLIVSPTGDVLPCLAAAQLPGPGLPSVRTDGLADIWYSSATFNRFRGTDWMAEPCRGCALRDVDFGGCRCQAYQLTGDPARTDPACGLSPDHHLVTAIVSGVGPDRPAPRPRRLS